MKKIFLHGIIAGVLAAIAGIIYFNIYQNTLGTPFNKVVNPGAITGACIFACVLMSVGYMLLERFNKQKLYGWLNVVIAVLSFASITGPISMSLPLDIKNPELFPGLIVPMHFFPAMAYFCIAPFFKE
jgi:drug/metabolite transporter (DMT)-like permease